MYVTRDQLIAAAGLIQQRYHETSRLRLIERYKLNIMFSTVMGIVQFIEENMMDEDGEQHSTCPLCEGGTDPRFN